MKNVEREIGSKWMLVMAIGWNDREAQLVQKDPFSILFSILYFFVRIGMRTTTLAWLATTLKDDEEARTTMQRNYNNFFVTRTRKREDTHTHIHTRERTSNRHWREIEFYRITQLVEQKEMRIHTPAFYVAV
jgi:hypothetical protein